MKKYLTTIIVIIVSIVILSVLLLSDYRFSILVKVIFIISTSLLIGYLFNKKAHTEDSVETSKNILNSIINSTDDLIFYKDKDLNYLGCNEAYLKYIDKKKEEIIGRSDFELFDEKIALQYRETDQSMLEKNEISSHEKWVPFINNQEHYLLIKKIPFHYNETSIGVLGITRDITERYLSQKKMQLQSYEDELTKLKNRKSYNGKILELFSLKKRYKTSFSMIMYDIDNFKSINDTYGHKVGDDVLIEMSKLIASHLRENDYIFRIGGEEFIILLSEAHLDDAKKVAQKICTSVEKDLKNITGNKITISIGVSEANENDSEDTIFKRVDSLLYKSKNSGKNRISY
ncbi:diguanylate cyclase [Sulfurimonas aquatica]|uniref:diguanylate cyclase n=1 Tax=Sulfurimonas aquatica TaxID=2672570 RepID=A0A975B1P0_9BACT|nr:GGDEF domain-containing protein [Sulfurimonas aquatica]QSZ42611.1 diguanylate cyclase [Sulfurimonas aquatica]